MFGLKVQKISMSNIKVTFWFIDLRLPDCYIDVLLREDTYCVQVSRLDGRIFKRDFVEYES